MDEYGGMVPGFPQFILSPYLFMDEYGGVGPWIPQFILSPYLLTYEYGGWSLDFLNLSFLHIYLWMNMVWMVPGFP